MASGKAQILKVPTGGGCTAGKKGRWTRKRGYKEFWAEKKVSNKTYDKPERQVEGELRRFARGGRKRSCVGRNKR